METELRTYNLRDPKGFLAFSTHDPEEAESFLDDHKDHHLDDFTKGEVRERAKNARAAKREAERDEKAAEAEREKQLKARVKELADPKALARAIAELEANG